jgi:hypothetical protein
LSQLSERHSAAYYVRGSLNRRPDWLHTIRGFPREFVCKRGRRKENAAIEPKGASSCVECSSCS